MTEYNIRGRWQPVNDFVVIGRKGSENRFRDADGVVEFNIMYYAYLGRRGPCFTGPPAKYSTRVVTYGMTFARDHHSSANSHRRSRSPIIYTHNNSYYNSLTSFAHGLRLFLYKKNNYATSYRSITAFSFSFFKTLNSNSVTKF